MALASDAADVRYSLTMLASELYALAQVAMLSFHLSLSIESYIHLAPHDLFASELACLVELAMLKITVS